jgi:hypothetical protein
MKGEQKIMSPNPSNLSNVETRFIASDLSRLNYLAHLRRDKSRLYHHQYYFPSTNNVGLFYVMSKYRRHAKTFGTINSYLIITLNAKSL